MRRSFSIFLVLLFGLSPLASAFDAGQEASLPACCRRHGAHHCAMAMEAARRAEQGQGTSFPAFTSPLTCSHYPSPATLMTGPVPALASLPGRWPALAARAFAHPATLAAAFSRPATTHAGRGPPAAI